MSLNPGQPVDVNDIKSQHNADGTHDKADNIDHGLAANRPSSPVKGDVYISDDVPKISYCAVDGAWVDIIGCADEKARVSADDSTAGYLNGKIVADGLALTEVNPGGNEVLQLGLLPGTIVPYAGKALPSGWLFCAGQAVSRSTYANLFAVPCPSMTCTISIASPAVITATVHGLSIGDRIRFTTTGSLPTGISTGTDYYIIAAGFTTDSFQVSTTFGGAAVNTSGSQSGTHTVQSFVWGVGDGATTFNVPDLRGRFLLGKDNLGGTPANRVENPKADAMGQGDGEENHLLTIAEMPAPPHAISNTASTPGPNNTEPNTGRDNATTTGSTGGGLAHNNMPPWVALNYIIKT